MSLEKKSPVASNNVLMESDCLYSEEFISSGAVTKIQDIILDAKRKKFQSGRKLKVCFFVTQIEFWSMQSIYDAFKEYPEFTLLIIPFPVLFHTGYERRKNYRDLCKFHRDKGASVLEVVTWKGDLLVELDALSPDIVFYEQHWMIHIHPDYVIQKMFQHALCFCIPYGLMIANIPERQFNGPAHNLAWRNFVETPMHLDLVKRYATNKGVNAIASGYPKLDAYSQAVKKQYWKTSSPDIKRIIWAPHYSIDTGTRINFSTFMLYCEQMFYLARSCKDHIEIILKPHPALKSHCLRMGVDRETFDGYMQAWSSLPNASIVTGGDYIDLFMTSDAMLLDSLGFISEYLVTGKPLCFLSKYKTFDELSTYFNDYGKEVISLLDIAYDFSDITNFVQQVCHGTLQESDKRKQFVDTHIKVNFGHVGDYIVNYIVESLRVV